VLLAVTARLFSCIFYNFRTVFHRSLISAAHILYIVEQFTQLGTIHSSDAIYTSLLKHQLVT